MVKQPRMSGEPKLSVLWIWASGPPAKELSKATCALSSFIQGQRDPEEQNCLQMLESGTKTGKRGRTQTIGSICGRTNQSI